MKKIYIDPVTFQCFLAQDEENTRILYETERFDGKCDAFIEGHRIVPSGCKWVRSDGKVFSGEMITVWKPYNELVAAQEQYELMMAETEAAYQEGVNSAYDQ